MKVIFGSVFVLLAAISLFSQKPDDVLATATARTFTLKDMPAEVQQAVTGLPTRTFATRAGILDQMVSQRLLDAEAKATGVSAGKILANEKAKIPNPAEAEIKAVYDANRQALGDRTLEQARKQIVSYLRREPEQKLIGALISRLKVKFKFAAGKAVNSPGLAPADVVATINSQPISAKDYEEFAKIALYELSAEVSDLVVHALEEAIYNALIIDEAKSLNMDAGAFIAREITNKMREFTDAERIGLEKALSSRLWAKYKVNTLYKAPAPLVQSIAVDDDPASGPADAPVTVVMFSDFECSACAATHPVLKRVIEMYPGKVRFVVRDFPLESIHENGFKAALAASAANAQGKFFEYTEILYKNQAALDTPSLKKYAADLGLNAKQFELDFNSEKTAAEVRKDMADGEAYVVNSTPTIFINGVRIRHLSADGFREAIEKVLAK